VFRIVHILMYAAPIGAFGAMAFTIGQYGIGTLANLAGLIATFYVTSLLFVIVVLGLVARVAGFSLFGLIRYIKDELLLVLGTSSSESAMPLLMEKLERAGCPKPIVGLVVPTGYSFNLDGTNIYMSLAALFIAQATNTPLTFGDQMLLMAVAILSSKGAAGVTGSGFIVLAATLSVIPTVPVAGMALILGVDRFMSHHRRRALGEGRRHEPAARRIRGQRRRPHRGRERRASDRGAQRRSGLRHEETAKPRVLAAASGIAGARGAA
jgi:aerobic C4-dicarboxylate transport protein